MVKSRTTHAVAIRHVDGARNAELTTVQRVPHLAGTVLQDCLQRVQGAQELLPRARAVLRAGSGGRRDTDL